MTMDYDSDMEDGVEATIWRILRRGYLRARLHGTGRAPDDLDEAQQNEALDGLLAAMESDMAMIMAAVRQAEAEVHVRFRHQMHAAPGLDHEMVDQAIDFAVSDGDGWEPL